MPKTTKGLTDSPTPTTIAPKPNERKPKSTTPKPVATPTNRPRASPSAKAVEAAPTPKKNPLSAGVYTPRGLHPKTATQLTPAQIENAKLVSISYIMDTQMQGAGGSVADSFLDGTETLLMNNLDYEMINDLSTKDYVVVRRGQETKIVFRGKQDDTDMPHAKRVIRGEMRDYSELDTLYETLAKRNPGGEIEIVSYSNGTPKGLYLSEKYNLQHFAIDGLLGPQETRALINRSPGAAPLELMKTTQTGLSSPAITAAQAALGREITNTTLTEINPVKATGSHYEQFVEQHSLSNYQNRDRTTNRPLSQEDRVPSSLRTRIAGSVATGIVPGVLGNLLVESLAPKDTPKEGKIAEQAIATSGLTRVISPLAGVGAMGMSESLLPLYAALEAGDKTGEAVDQALPESTPATARGAIEGGVSGAAGGAAFGVAAAGQKVAGRAIAQGAARLAAPAGGYALLATTEEATIGTGVLTGVQTTGYAALAASEEAAILAESAVVTEEIGLGAAALAGAEMGGLLTSELGPLALVGAAVGAGVGLLTAALTSG